MKRVLVINQSSELYGADKALLELLDHFPTGYVPVVVLEHEGPLKDILEQRGITVIKSPVIKISRALFSFRGLLKIPVEFIRSQYILWRATRALPISLVHSNAISVFAGAFHCFFFRRKHVWHVHEIIEHPRFLAALYPRLVYFFSDRIIYNSNASYENFRVRYPKVEKKSIVVPNGQRRTVPVLSEAGRTEIRSRLFGVSDESPVIALIGRISRWKGQLLLLESFLKVHAAFPTSRLVYVGSTPPGQPHFLETLENAISASGLSHMISIVDFQEDIWPVYDAVDICVVPSTEPEPFGLVATEAMLSSKPVIAANHGGLTEIVEEGVTGFLFTPNDKDDLASKLSILLADASKMVSFGQAGKRRAEAVFSAERYASSIGHVYDALTED
ncbi:MULTISPECIES: glycosyltransferase family 4 protein [unclassified Flavobacterium]|uniref:glycosyltransferase family 4 protein n=1 Tax=unclassified Flavobacterium TaxID=196869 RepID=UPI001F12BC76|nr:MULTISPECIES: glycosyltransferase family 4 protein [unclassified Flavobacterium]UMY66393.1 glycosyltransferase family 4 protein [Flavobacterium sp. HJ-32-4]